MNAHVPSHHTIDAAALAQLFTEARTHNAFLDRPVSDELAEEGGRSRQDGADQRQPVADAHRVREVEGGQGEARCRRCRRAIAPRPAPRRWSPSSPMTRSSTSTCRSCFRTPTPRPGSPATRRSPSAARSRTARCRSPISSWRLRAVGLDTGPMTGFDNAKVDAEFFADSDVQVERHHQHRLRRRRETVPAQPAFHASTDRQDRLNPNRPRFGVSFRARDCNMNFSVIPAALARRICNRCCASSSGLLFLEHGTGKLLNFPGRSMTRCRQDAGRACCISRARWNCRRLADRHRLSDPAGGVRAVRLHGRRLFHGAFAAGLLPALNGGEPAILYCFVFLYLAAAGAGPISVDVDGAVDRVDRLNERVRRWRTGRRTIILHAVARPQRDALLQARRGGRGTGPAARASAGARARSGPPASRKPGRCRRAARRRTECRRSGRSSRARRAGSARGRMRRGRATASCGGAAHRARSRRPCRRECDGRPASPRAIASRTRLAAGGYSRIASSNTALVTGSRSVGSLSSAGSKAASISASTRARQSGACDSR